MYSTVGGTPDQSIRFTCHVPIRWISTGVVNIIFTVCCKVVLLQLQEPDMLKSPGLKRCWGPTNAAAGLQGHDCAGNSAARPPGGYRSVDLYLGSLAALKSLGLKHVGPQQRLSPGDFSTPG